MGFRDKTYGVTWRTTTSDQPTTVWFYTQDKRNNFVTDLLRNKRVVKKSIRLSSRNVDDDE